MRDAPDLRGQVALVTGASRGLGRALAAGFGRAGARVAICARGGGPLDDAATALRREGIAVEARALDVTDADVVADFVGHLTARWGPVTALVNCASILGQRVPLRDYRLVEWRRVLDVNLTGSLIAARAVIPGMRDAGGGSITNVTSGVGNEPRADWGAYAVSKWAVEALTYNMALEERDGGIRVNAVDPGSMRTAMRRAAYPDEDPSRLPEPESAVGVFLWLASDDAAGVTGQRLRARDWSA